MNCKDSYLVHDFSPRFSSKNLIVLIFACPGCQAPSTSHRSGDLLLLLLGLLLLVPLLLIELLCISTTTTTKPCGKTGREIHTCTKRQYMHFHSFSTGFRDSYYHSDCIVCVYIQTQYCQSMSKENIYILWTNTDQKRRTGSALE